MINAINLEKGISPNWEQFIAYLANCIAAKMYHLVVNDSHYGVDIKQPIEKGYVFEFNTYLNDCLLSFTFLFSGHNACVMAEQRFFGLQQYIETTLQLATKLRKKQNRQAIAQTCVERAQVGLLTLDEKGNVLDKNTIVEPLLQAGLFCDQHKQLSFTDSPKWLASQLKLLSHTEDESVYLTLQWQEQIIHCVLSNAYRPEQSEKSKRYQNVKTQQFLLMIYLVDIPPSVTFLRQLYSLSEAEAHIVSWFSLGLSAEHVAKKTGYTVHTVYSYIKKLYSTINIHKQSQLTALVWQQQPL